MQTFTLDYNLNTFVIISNKTHDETTIESRQAVTLIRSPEVTFVTRAARAHLNRIMQR